MTQIEKANELIEKFYPQVQWKMGQEDCMDRAKQCALIAVDLVLTTIDSEDYISRAYWRSIKKEIEKL